MEEEEEDDDDDDDDDDYGIVTGVTHSPPFPHHALRWKPMSSH